MEREPYEFSDDESDSDADPSAFDKDRHVRFLQMMYQLLPSAYQGQEINRITLAYFVISGLNILGAMDCIDRVEVIDWVLSFQVFPQNESDLENGKFYGFHGSRSSQFDSKVVGGAVPNGGHLASTYCALSILKIVGYDFSLFDMEYLLKSMKQLQQPDGCFMPIGTGAEKDLRFVFCAAAICSLLKNWGGMDREKAKNYITSCQSFDGGFGLIPGYESHVSQVVPHIVLLRLSN